jgi:hypothetical protein
MYYSEYFQKALKNSWKEGKEGVVILEDIEPAVCEPSGKATRISGG